MKLSPTHAERLGDEALEAAEAEAAEASAAEVAERRLARLRTHAERL